MAWRFRFGMPHRAFHDQIDCRLVCGGFRPFLDSFFYPSRAFLGRDHRFRSSTTPPLLLCKAADRKIVAKEAERQRKRGGLRQHFKIGFLNDVRGNN